MIYQSFNKKLRYIAYCVFLSSSLFLNISYSVEEEPQYAYINEATNKDSEVKNVFDEIYFKNAPYILNYHLSTTASMTKTGCVSRLPYSFEFNPLGLAIEDVKRECLWSNKIEAINFFYYLTNNQFIFVVFFLPTDEESKNIVFALYYYADKKHLEINYAHVGQGDELIVDSYKFGTIPESYYKKYNLSREELVKTADDILYNHLLPMYFDKNRENGGISKFSMENLGEFTVDYRF